MSKIFMKSIDVLHEVTGETQSSNSVSMYTSKPNSVPSEKNSPTAHLHPHNDQRSALSPPMNIEFARITQLSDEQLQEHEERLVRNLQDLDTDDPNQLYRPTDS